MADATAKGRFVWHELITPNGEGAHDFYSKVLGWNKQAWEHEPSYSMFVGPEGPLGAAVENRAGVPHWLPYVGVPSVDDAVARAEAQGAKVVTPPTEVPNAGRHAVLNDAQGATFAVHSSSMPASPDRAPARGEFSWHELATTVDPTEVFPLYAELFGWDEIRRHDMGDPMGTYLIFGRNGVEMGGMFNKGNMGRPGPAYWVSYVSVPDLGNALEQLKSGRGTVLHGPSDVPGGDKIAQVMDPHGAFFALHWTANTPAAQPARKPVAKAPAAKARAAKAPAVRAEAKPAAKPAKPALKPAAKPAAKKTAKKAARKAAKKVAKKATKKVTKKAPKKAAKKVARKVAKKPAKKAAPARSKAAKKKARGKRR
jgi:predicted enzyme related to lactoylglutathione lyase